jgi:cytoskeleton protein RodZ
MSDVEQEAMVEAPGEAVGRSVGEMLREARQRLNLEAADVARQLRLGLRQIEALEANDFAALPGNTIVRGFIRNYARLLQTDPADLLAAYEASLPKPEAPRIAAAAENIDISTRPTRRWLIILLAVIALVIGTPLLIYALLHDDTPAPAGMPAPVAQAPAPSAQALGAAEETTMSVPLPAMQPVATVPVEGAAPPATEPPAQASASTAAPAPESAPKTPVANAPIQLAFEEDAWVEIRDRSGKRVYSQIGRKGSSDAVAGEAPFSLVVGNAAKVRIIYKGKPLDLQPHIKVNVARLTLE